MSVKIKTMGQNGFPLSDYQKEIIEFIVNEPEKGSRNLMVQAYAGCSKTTTIMESLQYIPRKKSVLLTCFNKRIANELQAKSPSHVDACTMNSLGNKIVKKFAKDENIPYVKIDGWKSVSIIKEMIEKGDEEFKGYEHIIKNLCESAKNHGLIPSNSEFGDMSLMEDSKENWFDLMDRFGTASKIESKIKSTMDKAYSHLSPSQKDAKIEELVDQTKRMAIRGAREVLNKGIKILNVIDFTDQLYLPFVYGLSCGNYDYVFVDEAQDLNPIQHEMLMLCIGAESRVVVVGDRKQAIYQFRGSMSDSMDKLLERFNCVEKVLPLSYRCPKEVIQEAQVFVPEIEAALDHKGTVMDKGFYDYSKFNRGDMVLCRFNAPLLTVAYDLLAAHIPFEIRGRDFIGDMISMITGFKAEDIDDLGDKLEKWRHEQVTKKVKQNPDANVSAIEDKYEAINNFLEMSEFRYVGQVVKKLKELQAKCKGDNDDTGGGVILSTVHQSKGLEADTVYFLNVAKLPCKYAKKPEEMEAEKNIVYVGITRAKKNLFYIATEEDALLNKIGEQVELHGECTIEGDDKLLAKVLEDKRRYGLGFAIKDFLVQSERIAWDLRDDSHEPLQVNEDGSVNKRVVPEQEIEGHWRQLSNPNAIGKDQNGNRNQTGRTWVVDHERGAKDVKGINGSLHFKKTENGNQLKISNPREASNSQALSGMMFDILDKNHDIEGGDLDMLPNGDFDMHSEQIEVNQEAHELAKEATDPLYVRKKRR